MVDLGVRRLWVLAVVTLMGCASDEGDGTLDQRDSGAPDGLGHDADAVSGDGPDGAGEDTGTADTGADTGSLDTGADTATLDTGVTDTGSSDTALDTGSVDTGVTDSGVTDTGPGDTASPAPDPAVAGPLSFTSTEVEHRGRHGEPGRRGRAPRRTVCGARRQALRLVRCQ